MKNGRSLEEQRRELLEQIHASRATYRRMLTHGESGGAPGEEGIAALNAESGQATKVSDIDPAFPRSETLRWVVKHPFFAAAAIVGLAMAAPKAVGLVRRSSGKSNVKRGRNKHAYHGASSPYYSDRASHDVPHGNYGPPPYAYQQPIYIEQPSTKKAGVLAGVAAFGGTALTSLVTIATVVMRDPAKMQMAMRLFSQASQYLRNHRAQQATKTNTENPAKPQRN